MLRERLSLLICLMFFAAGARALAVENVTFDDGVYHFYFGYFEVKNVELRGGVLELPLERGEYKNIKILTQDLLNKMTTCTDTCQPETLKKPAYQISEMRTAGANLIIADVLFDGELAVTFLINRYTSRGKESLRINKPSDFEFSDAKFEREVKEFLKNAVLKQN